MDLDTKAQTALETEAKTMPISSPLILQQPSLSLVPLPSPSIAHIIRSTTTFFANVYASLDSTSKVTTASLTPSSQLFAERIKSTKIAAVYAPKVSILLVASVTFALPTLAIT